MSCSLSRAVLVSGVALFCFTAVVGCDFGAKRIYPQQVDADKAAAEAMEMYDTNKDGKLDGEELKNVDSLAKLAKDGVVTADLISAELKRLSSGKIGRLRFNVEVFHNRKPLVGAEVKFLPEKFLGPAWPSAAGKTNENGVASVTVPNAPEARGLPLGIYRVEITKEGENIPAKYNTATTLSVGIYHPPGPGVGQTFNLDY